MTIPELVAASPVRSRIRVRPSIATAVEVVGPGASALVGSPDVYARSYLAMAEQAMAECVKRVTTELRSAGMTEV